MTEAVFDESSQPKTIAQPFPQFHKLIIDPVVNTTRSFINWMEQTLLGHIPPNFRPDEMTDYEEFQIYLDTWLTSINEPLCEFSDEIPDWFDSEKFARGRSFAMKHLLGLLYAEQLSVVLLMSLPMLRRPLIFSGKSDTAEKAFRRYLSTVERVMTWYSQDIWDKHSAAYRHLLVVRGMHKQAEHSMKSCSATQRNSIFQQYETSSSGTGTPLLDSLRADLKPYLPNTQQQIWLERFQTNENGLFINQLGMACTQMGFVGLMILEPGKFGASRASKADLDDFVYVWYVLGHQLGIANRFNLCSGGLEETQRRCKHIMRHVVLPSLALAGTDWEHMSQCVIGGVDRILRQTSFEASLAYTLWALNVHTPHIESIINWKELSRLWFFKSVLCTLHSIPGVPDIFGALLRIRLSVLRKRLDTVARMRIQ